MKRLVSLGVCLSLSIFTMARAMKPSHMLAIVAKTAQEKNESSDMFEAEEQEVGAEEGTDEAVASADDDSMEDASDDEGENMGVEDAGDDDAGGDDDGGDDDGGVD